MLVIVLLYRRFRRSATEVPYACHAAAAIALSLGAATVIGGVGHSIAVVSVALGEREYGPLQILRFTTGAMLVYSGAMNLAVYPAMKAGRRLGEQAGGWYGPAVFRCAGMTGSRTCCSCVRGVGAGGSVQARAA